MSGTRANIIKTPGLQTYGNELTRSSGSLKQALNVNIDEDGVITPRRGFNDYKQPTTGAESIQALTSQIMEYKKAIIRQYDDKLEYEDSNNDFQSINGIYEQLRDGFRTKWQEANSNLYFTSSEGIKKISEKSQEDFSSDMVVKSGAIKAGYASGVTAPTVGGFLPPQSKVAYRVLFGYKDNSNNLILGAPSSRFIVINYAEDSNVFEASKIVFSTTGGDELSNGDHFIYQDSTGKYTIYFDIDGSAEEPKTAQTIASTYIKVPTGNINNDNTVLATITANVISNSLANAEVTIGDTVDTVIITSKEEGDIIGISDPAYASDGTTDISSRLQTSVDTDGSTTTGTSANVVVEGVVPPEITTDYFYQVYRTPTISTALGLDLNDLDPGDEANLVYESGLTQTEIDDGIFSFTDNTPESFRAESTPLYTNQITGEGINQSNEIPPIALDIELFRNYMFYGNTKQRHKLNFAVVSVDDFISESTRIIIGNDEITRYYTFVGTKQVQDYTIDSIPSAGDYDEFKSANNERSYYIYYGDSGNDPNIEGSIGYRINLTDLATTDEVATKISTVLLDNVDVNISVTSSVLTFTWANNGYTDGLTSGSGTDTTISTPSTDGTGELKYDVVDKPEGGDVLLSGLASAGQSIDETARSLVKIISQDPLSPVSAYYLSTSEDLPGDILLEAKSIEDRTFYISIEESSFDLIGEEFTPDLPLSKPIEELNDAIDPDFTTITLTGHGYSDGDSIFIGYYKDPNNPSDPESFSGIYTISGVTTDTFDIEINNFGLSSFVPAFSTVYTASVESDNEEITNRIYYSKVSEPEAVPTENFFDVGARDAEIKRILALRDELYVLKDDGIFVVSGTSAPNWSVRLVDSTRIIAPDSAVVLNNQIYCLTEQGIARISGASASIISRGIENKIDMITNEGFDFSPNTFGVAYENDRAYILFAPEKSSDSSATQAYRYNIFERTWTRWEYDATCGHVLARDNKLYLGNGDRNYISQERKNNDRSDYSDRNFTATINANSINKNLIELSTIVDVSVNDVIVQKQDVTLYYINNRLLKKMDFFDTGITPPSGSTMFDSFNVVRGDNLPSKMQAINDHLRSLDPTYITDKNFTFSNIRTLTELLVTELNTVESLTSTKTYKNPYTVYYEAFIQDLNFSRNTITVSKERPFIEGDIEVYKGYSCNIEWNPQHFGDPSALKQIRYVTIIFDQNNFNTAVSKFTSDASQSVTTVDFKGKGLGYWDDLEWNNLNAYWGGNGNDIPFRNPVPRGKQKCRYLSLTFEHKNAREYFRILGISGVVRAISDRAYR